MDNNDSKIIYDHNHPNNMTQDLRALSMRTKFTHAEHYIHTLEYAAPLSGGTFLNASVNIPIKNGDMIITEDNNKYMAFDVAWHSDGCSYFNAVASNPGNNIGHEIKPTVPRATKSIEDQPRLSLAS